MVALESLRHHGKRFLHEIDHRTHTSKSTVDQGVTVPGHNNGFPNEQATVAGLRREFSLALLEDTALWWFDMFGDWFKGQQVLDAIGQMERLWTNFASEPRESASEVALIVDAESMLYVDGRAPLIPEFMYNQRAGLYRMGAPFDVLSMADVAEIDVTRYKLVLFPNLFAVDQAKREVLESKILRDGKTVVWVYAPGIIDGNTYDPAHVEALNGHRHGAQELASKDMDWLGLGISAPKPNLPARCCTSPAQQSGRARVFAGAGTPVRQCAVSRGTQPRWPAIEPTMLPRTCARCDRTLQRPGGRRKTPASFTDRSMLRDTVL